LWEERGCTRHLLSLTKRVMDMLDRFFQELERVVGWINTVFVFVSAVLMTGLVVIVCTDVLLRYFFRSPLVWATEVTEIMLLDLTFLGAGWVLREDGHVVIDIFTAKASERGKRVLGYISYGITALVAFILAYYGFTTTYDHYRRGIFNPTAIETPIWFIILVIPLGSVPLLLEAILKEWKLITRKKSIAH
jgi:TRAP-type C4-dicarboxylate transport system permease small subunit